MHKSMSIHQKMIVKGYLSLNFLHHVLPLVAQSQQTPTSLKSILGTVERIYSIVTSPLYTILQQGITCSLCVSSSCGILVL